MTDSGDAAARREALDPDRSFIVQAPAGSGKTELLIQRHLVLLARVRHPEQVVAVTFTRKAAAEMRARVLDVLELAATGETVVAPHRRLSLTLAQAVLERDRALDWGILERPGRLRIDTVDALNGWLAERLPIASGGMAGAAVIDNAGGVYRRAVARMLEGALTDDQLRQAAGSLLRAADNSFENLVRATAAVVPMRDQWLGLFGDGDRERLERALKAGLAGLAQRCLAAARQAVGSDCFAELTELVAHATAHADGALQADGNDGGQTDRAGDGIVQELAFWRAAAALLLTASGGWRRRLTRREGFAPAHKAQKGRATALIESLAGNEAAREALLAIGELPSLVPSAAQMDRAMSAVRLLLQSVAELKVLFQEEQAVDFLELALGAQAALGSAEAPSELLLALDGRIEHLLVDEFQDTSHSQFRLLELLTAGWSGEDGRTLFLVGDPMQSIYRFRDADMSLFLRAKATGIGAVGLRHLVLRRNFRSAPAIVDWVNASFSALFPEADDPVSGRAAYYAFESTRQAEAGDCVTLHRTAEPGLAAQHALVAGLAAERLAARDSGSMAVLVQSRSHLRGLRAVLEAAGVEARAVELDSLAEQQAVQDLLALTRALLHPADRIAWLALLRAPWCGLSWSDIHELCAAAPDTPVFELLTAPEALCRLRGDEAEARVRFLAERLSRGLALRGRYPLPKWIECCWQLLDGPATLDDPAELDAVQRYFSVLDTLIVNGDVPDTVELTRALDVPFSSVRRAVSESGAAPLEIMTVHRAKGLEFDTVILFGLDRRVRGADTKLLYWQSPNSTADEAGLLFAAMDTAGDPLAAYLQRIDRELDRAERARLLYVAVTRARRRLHLIGHLADDGEPGTATGNTLMSWLAPQFRRIEAPAAVSATGALPPDAAWVTVPLTALDPDAGAPAGPLAGGPEPARAERREFEWASPVAAHVGSVVHRALQRAGAEPGTQPRIVRAMDAGALQAYRRELALLGVPAQDLDLATGRVREILEHVSASRDGMWILAGHAQARSEYELAVVQAGRVMHLRIDRTFVDADGIRWIIDYKTSRHAGGDRSVFLDAETARYRPQLDTYARAMYRLDPGPVRVGLYFPLLDAFRVWEPELPSGA